jgi:hypothetical protein
LLPPFVVLQVLGPDFDKPSATHLLFKFSVTHLLYKVNAALVTMWLFVVLQVLGPEFDKPPAAQLQGFLQQEWAAGTVYPPKESIFRAFNSVPFDQVGPAAYIAALVV